MLCKRKSVYQCGKNLLATRDCDCKAKKAAIISCSVGIKDWGYKNKVLFYICSSAEFHLYSDCMYMLPLAHFVISSHFICRVSLFSSSVLLLLRLHVHVHCSLATSCTFCNQLTPTHVIRHFILLLYIYARQRVDPSCPIGRQWFMYNE